MGKMKNLKDWFMGLSKRGKTFAIIAGAVVLLVILELIS